MKIPINAAGTEIPMPIDSSFVRVLGMDVGF